MKLSDMNWMQVEEYLRNDNRVVLPLGSTEQHAYLSLCVDCILSEKVAADAAEPLGIPVLPTVNYGLTPYFTAYPGTISLRMETYVALVRDILDNLAKTGFRRILIVNGHGGNRPVQGFVNEWLARRPECAVRFHNWWNAPEVQAKVNEIDPVASHASWMENFPWTRLPGVTLPEGQKPMTDLTHLAMLNPQQVREYIGDGNYGGVYQRSDADTDALWAVAVREVRQMLETGWP